jgi:hypothetical protein
MAWAFMIAYISADGEEREERWASVEAFRNWAIAQGAAYDFTAYREDQDGEWEVVEKGRVGSAPPRQRRARRRTTDYSGG